MNPYAGTPTGAVVVVNGERSDEAANKIAVMTLHVPGGDLRVEEQAHTFEEAIDNGLDVMKRRIEKHKEK